MMHFQVPAGGTTRAELIKGKAAAAVAPPYIAPQPPQKVPESPVEIPSLPSMTAMAKNITASLLKSTASVIKGQGLKVTAEEAARRLTICKSCPFFRTADERCSKCGCYMSVKTYLKAEKCPERKW